MGSYNKSSGLMKFKFNNTLKKSGIYCIRFIFNGTEKITGTEKTFFIEFSMINPYISQTEPILGFKPRINISPEDLQNVLAGTTSAQKIQSETLVQPSYIVIRSGLLGINASQICKYNSIKNISFNKKTFDISMDNCVFTNEILKGQIECSPQEIQEHPEYLCNSGHITWNLRYENQISFSKGYKSKLQRWSVPGGKTVFAGSVTFNGKEYSVIPKNSFGYVEYFTGKTLPDSWIHISSSNLTSIISGKLLQNSCFTIQGVFNERISILINIDGKQIMFLADSKKRSYQAIWDISQTPDNESEPKIHWSVSSNNKLYVIDIDLFCPSKQLFVRSWEKPEGKRKILRILSGATGIGEIRLYKRIHKNLELIEHAHIASAFCEFGQPEIQDQ